MDIYELAARVSLDVMGFGSAAAVAMGVFRQLQMQATAATGSATALSKGLKLVAAGMVVFAGGMAGIGVLKLWTSAAADLQAAMAGVGLATRGTAAQLNALQAQAFITANRTQFSATDIATIERIAATNGLNQRDVLLNVIPTLGNLAEIDQQLRGISYQQSVPAAIRVAHDFQSYPTNPAETKRFTGLLDLFGRSQLVAGISPDEMSRLITYLMPARAAFNLKPADVIATAALAANTGLSGGRGGGSTLAAMFRTVVPLLTARGAIHNRALEAIEQRGGGSFFGAGGQFEGVSNMLTVVMRAMQHTKSQQARMELLATAFQASGARAMAVMTTPGAIKRFASIQSLLGPDGIASTRTMQAVLNSTIQGQWRTFQSNLTSINALLGQQLLPILAPVVHGLVEFSGAIVTFLRMNPAIAQFIAVFALVATTVALIVGPLLVFAGLLSIVTGTVGLGALIGVVAPVVGVFLLLTAAVAAIVLVITHWSDIMNVLGDGIHNLLITLGLIHDDRPHVYYTKTPPGYNPAHPGVTPTVPDQGTNTIPGGVVLHHAPKPDKHPKPWHPAPAPHFGIGGGGYVPPVTVHGGIHIAPVIHAAPGHDEEQLAHRVAALTAQKLGDVLQATVDHGATTVLGLSPSLNAAR